MPGALAPAQEMLDVGEATLWDGYPENLLDSPLDDLFLFGAEIRAIARPDEKTQQVLQEVSVLRGAGKLQRIEPRRLPWRERLVSAAERANEHFGAAILVEEGATW